MHAAAWRCGGRAEVEAWVGSCVVTPGRPKQKLPHVHHATSDVAPHEVGGHRLQIGGRKNAARQNTFSKARRKALNLIFQSGKHIDLRPIGHMAISPRRVFPGRSPRGVKEARLHQQNERAL